MGLSNYVTDADLEQLDEWEAQEEAGDYSEIRMATLVQWYVDARVRAALGQTPTTEEHKKLVCTVNELRSRGILD